MSVESQPNQPHRPSVRYGQTHVWSVKEADVDSNGNIGTNGTLNDRLSSVQPTALFQRSSTRSIKGRGKGADAQERKEQGEELEEAEHGGVNECGGVLIIGGWWWESCECLQMGSSVDGGGYYIPPWLTSSAHSLALEPTSRSLARFFKTTQQTPRYGHLGRIIQGDMAGFFPVLERVR